MKTHEPTIISNIWLNRLWKGKKWSQIIVIIIIIIIIIITTTVIELIIE